MNIGYSRISIIKESKGTPLDFQNQKIEEYCKLH